MIKKLDGASLLLILLGLLVLLVLLGLLALSSLVLGLLLLVLEGLLHLLGSLLDLLLGLLQLLLQLVLLATHVKNVLIGLFFLKAYNELRNQFFVIEVIAVVACYANFILIMTTDDTSPQLRITKSFP